MAQDFRNDLQSAVGTSEATLITGSNFDAVILLEIYPARKFASGNGRKQS